MDGNNIITMRGNDGGIIKIESHNALASTLELARRYAHEDYPDRYVVFTPKKVLDDGEIENGLYMSILLRPSIFPSQATLLGALSATAMVTALSEHTPKRLGLGWVSDLYCEGIKIGDSSIEGKLDNFTSYEYIIVTYSVKVTEATFPPRITDMIKEVFEEGNTSVTMIMAKNILLKFFSLYVNIKTSTKFMDIYSERFIQRGLKVRYTDGQKRYILRILNVDAKTCALVRDGPGGKPSPVFSPRNVQLPKKIKLKKKV